MSTEQEKKMYDDYLQEELRKERVTLMKWMIKTGTLQEVVDAVKESMGGQSQG